MRHGKRDIAGEAYITLPRATPCNLSLIHIKTPHEAISSSQSHHRKQFGNMSRGDLKKISIKTEKKGYTK